MGDRYGRQRVRDSGKEGGGGGGGEGSKGSMLVIGNSYYEV